MLPCSHTNSACAYRVRYNLKVLHCDIFVSTDLGTILPAQGMVIFMIHLHTKFYMPSPDGLLTLITKQNTKENTTVTKFSYSPKICHYTSFHKGEGIGTDFIPTSKIRTSYTLLLACSILPHPLFLRRKIT
jgi:hypothetical protein